MCNNNRGLKVIAHTLVAIFVFLILGTTGCSQHQKLPDYLENGQSANLPLPSTMPLQDYERVLYKWLMTLEYKNLNWAVDKGVRDTGPFIENQYYGTHPAVRIYYSPEVMDWLRGDREGNVADGGVIVKEMFEPPAVLYEELKNDPRYRQDSTAYEELLGQLVTGWVALVKDSRASKDGWFWAGPGAPLEGESIPQAIDSQLDDYTHILYSNFGGTGCIRCHASAEKEYTFSTLKNIKGFYPDEAPLRFRVDNSWRNKEHLEKYPLNQIPDSLHADSLFVLPKWLRTWQDRTGLTPLIPSPHLRRLVPSVPVVTAKPLKEPNPEFIKTFPQITPVDSADVKAFPMQWSDHVVAGPDGAERYITADNCLGCHGGLSGNVTNATMFVQTGPGAGEGFNVSEYGEWRWSPMGLAGRDPIFHAQLESEMALLERDARANPSPLKGSLQENQQAVTNTCLSCHGAMGQRQLLEDAAQDSSLDPNFKIEYFYLTEALTAKDTNQVDYRYHKYGALAREGISCTICHHISRPDSSEVEKWNPIVDNLVTSATPEKELAYFLFHNTTGRYEPGPADELFGPFEKVVEAPMKKALDITPKHNPYITDSQMCGTCHTINLPNIGMVEDEFPVLTEAEQNPALKGYPHTIEQATFLEWQNSAFAGSDFQSCQDCHMPGGFKAKNKDGEIDIPQLVTQIATIQDASYPATENEAPREDIDVPLRTDYKRHEHVGLNVFLLEMFNQFSAGDLQKKPVASILGVPQRDYETGAANGNVLALQNMVRQAREETADLRVEVESFQNNVLTASVIATNKTGHRFPSGVAFRRAFLEFLVLNSDEIIWASGRTNSLGVIVDSLGNPLTTEFLPDSATYQRHHQKIVSQSQVQIYEELNQNAEHEFTTSFIHRVHDIKDNRLLPKGWRFSQDYFAGQGKVMLEFMDATDPRGVGDDPDYRDQGPDFHGQDSLQYVVTLPGGLDAANLQVRITMHYQAIPPYWLRHRFSLAPNGEATKRLYYLASHLNLQGTAMENWKLPLVSATAKVK